MKVLSLDIGASSGRFIVIEYRRGEFFYEETYRFLNGMEEIDGHLCWNFPHLFNEIEKGLQKTLAQHKDIKSIGVDTWAVDYGKLDRNDKLIANPIGYRDLRNEKAANELLKKVKYFDIYRNSGIQYLDFNTIFQLYSEKDYDFESILLIPDLINFYLTGNKFSEITNFSTTALYNPLTKEVSKENLKYINLDESKINPLIKHSKRIGFITKELCDKLNIYPLEVVSVGSHDTASAIASINLHEDSCYLSSGTWSLLGVELEEPLICKKTLEANFTNEVGLEDTIRFLKNIAGLFIIQEIKKDYEKINPSITFAQILEEATAVKENNVFIDVDDDVFSTPFKMIEKFNLFLKKTNQYIHDLTIGEMARSVYESLAFKYLENIQHLESLTNKKYTNLIIVGGGVNVTLLNQLIANILNLEVITGLDEATVYGNALAQFIYHQEFSSLKEARKILDLNTKKVKYHPQDNTYYQKQHIKYLQMINSK
ncbi:MAG TPA: rhamnulokinase family protein [Candidatus Onthovivens sp.]|nr:rhamnulokinase family protein [Candidatus Onthovivens sp.]